jgi:hypothetical protein
MMPRFIKYASAAAAVFGPVAGNSMSTKLATLGNTFRPIASIFSLSQTSHRVLCAFDAAACALSRRAATAAAWAALETLKGPRMRFSASTTLAGA